MEAGEFPSTIKTNQREGCGAGRGGQGRWGKKLFIIIMGFFFARVDLLEINQLIGRLINWADSLAP